MMTLEEVVMASGGQYMGDVNGLTHVISGITTDTRDDLTNKLFIALKGDRYDGHDYISNAVTNGAACVLSEIETSHKQSIIVKSTHNALRRLAEYYLRRFNATVIAVTGSAGKTTTKDLIASVLSQKYKTLKTQGNLNNEIGLPLTVFNMNESYEMLVLEMGMNHPGEIRNLSRIARPDICVITNIGEAHMENLGSKEGILKAKCEIFDYMKPDGQIFLNGTDEMLLTLKDTRSNINYYGTKDELSDIQMPIPGAHMRSNGMAAAAIGHALGLSDNEIKIGIEEFKPSANRMEIINKNGITIINDVYNANPSAMKAALDVLAEFKTRRVAVLGDMLELGESAGAMHYEIGEYAADVGIDMLICIGSLSRHTYEGAIAAGCSALFFPNQDSFIGRGQGIIQTGDTVLLKASRGMRFENMIYLFEV